MELTNKELLIFDLDGTLVDSVPDLALALNLMLQKLSHETFEEDIIRHWVGNGAQTLVRRALSGTENLDETLFNEALSIFLQFYKENLATKTCLYEGVTDTIQTLHQKNYTLAIVTNKPYEFVNPLLEHLQLALYFEHILGGDSLEVKKPHPQPLLHTCDILKIPKENAVVIGDSKNDIIAANQAGIESIAVSYGYNYDEAITIHNPTMVIDTFKELTNILG